jgi:hypothetical protein
LLWKMGVCNKMSLTFQSPAARVAANSAPRRAASIYGLTLPESKIDLCM